MRAENAALEEERDHLLATAKRPLPRSEAENLAKRFREYGEEYVRFVTNPEIGPTNNAAEQAIRFCVIDRRITQGTRSEMMVSQSSGLYYWARDAKSSNAEVDYLAVMDGTVYPVEVKSSAAGSLKSLHLLLKTYPNCPKGLVFSSRPYAELPEQKLTFLPLYYAYSATQAK